MNETDLAFGDCIQEGGGSRLSDGIIGTDQVQETSWGIFSLTHKQLKYLTRKAPITITLILYVLYNAYTFTTYISYNVKISY